MKIGVFDSGVGGKSVADAIKKSLPEADIILAEDKKHLPYGTKTPEQLLGFTKPIFQKLESQGCQAIVVACNTVSTTIIDELKKAANIPLIGMVPMVKPAAQLTKSKTTAVCATPATLASRRYAQLKDEFAKGIKILEPDCSDWAEMIESNQIDRQHIEKIVDEVCGKGADVIVLGCTHYHWIEDLMRDHAVGRAQVIQPIEPVIAQLKRVLSQRN